MRLEHRKSTKVLVCEIELHLTRDPMDGPGSTEFELPHVHAGWVLLASISREGLTLAAVFAPDLFI